MYAVRLQEWTTFAVLAAWFSFAAIFLFRRRPPASPEDVHGVFHGATRNICFHSFLQV